MPDGQVLRERARTAIRQGKLPARRPDRTLGGPGVVAICAVCDLPITDGDMELEIELRETGDVAGLDKFHLHARCFAAWTFERENTGLEMH